MSGGSYNYLGTVSADDIGELTAHLGDLGDMALRLAGLDYAQDAAKETEELRLMLRQWQVLAEVRARRLADVWHAVEWWDSCDYGEDQVRAALARYRSESP